MPRRNRVSPFGDFEVTTERGLFMGNRGILHDAQGRIGQARWRHKNWVACTLAFKDRRRTVMAPGRYTELFFCDEAVALAAGHRPCAECRRKDHARYGSAWQEAYSLARPPRSGDMDEALHPARVSRDRRQVTFAASLGDLPGGTFVSFPREPQAAWLVWRDRLHRWSHEGYCEIRRLDSADEAVVLTPGPTVRVLRAGYVPIVHSTAG